MKKLNVPSFVQVGPVGFFVAQNNCTDVEKSTVRLKLSSRVCLHILSPHSVSTFTRRLTKLQAANTQITFLL